MDSTCSIQRIANNTEITTYQSISGASFAWEVRKANWAATYQDRIQTLECMKGLRPPQYGALSAIRAHWTTSTAPATIVIPTGVGKTETILATIASQKIERTLIIVPNRLLRKQIYESARKFGKLREFQVLSQKTILPNTMILGSKMYNEDWEKFTKFIKLSNIVVSTPNLISDIPENLKEKFAKHFNLIVFDEAHHLPASTWDSIQQAFAGVLTLQFTATPFRSDKRRIAGELIYNYPLSIAQRDGYFKEIEFHPVEDFYAH